MGASLAQIYLWLTIDRNESDSTYILIFLMAHATSECLIRCDDGDGDVDSATRGANDLKYCCRTT